MLVLDSCCFCFNLRTGSLIIGYLNLVAEIILGVFSILGLTGGVLLIRTHDESSVFVGTVLTSISVATAFFTLIFLIFTIVLLVGLHKEKRGHVKAYLIYACIFLVMYSILFAVHLIMGTTGVLYIMMTVMEIALSIYFLLVIKSHYVMMKENDGV